MNSSDAAVEAQGPAEPVALIGADVGGTYARLGWAELVPGQPIQIRDFRRYACADYPSLAAILRHYMQSLRQPAALPPVRHAVVAIAGLLDGDTLLNTNLAWPVSLAATQRDAGLERLELINDFVAVAQAMPHVDRTTLHRICGHGDDIPTGPAVVLGPGTGLGVAVRLGTGTPSVLPSEAGHAALAANTALERDVLQLLSQRYEHIDNERVLSGPGLMALYACLCELRGAAVRWRDPAELVAASRGGDLLAVESIQAFCGWMGSLAGDLALTFGARAVYLTGGVTGHIAAELHDGAFQKRFVSKGALSPALRQVSVWRVDHGELGVLGALAWHADRLSDELSTNASGV
ncbi:MAG: glucokinase [Stenotrophomonas sp.]|uniref:glucokinase n=1 Tax=Stenotrophomonas sp. TaxID=69392 RepID=UPI003D6CA0F2